MTGGWVTVYKWEIKRIKKGYLDHGEHVGATVITCL